ncbi:BZ3500_MvSof-1268-A1-R1_Chr7-1g09126 [Microbotryum saponariae]|uniref:BZ3500_MvSof-1268-A1-R1_Chr7-1g09126 protein n=1 Tax=Microbotryum saponariae TaxID=289078 RepID=A0A2X0L7V4_9BASI|nr:BZ3501_MvSof-1269-A2-R1_Chr7-1g08831 [Microbotryum saponariae]SDA02851.1 BZ3500_MvSof-1268-A1-R1_Chr7-1g09126 [Microbotryum saponariae]
MRRRMGIPVASAQGPTTIQPGTTNASIFLASTSAVLNSEAAQDLDIPQSASSSSTDFSPSSDRRTLHGDDRLPASGSMDAVATPNQDNQDSDDSDAFEEPSMVRDSDDDDGFDDDRASDIPATRMGLRDSMMGSAPPEGLGIGMDDAQDFSASNEPLAGRLRRCQAMTGSLDVGLQSYSMQDPFVAAIEGRSTRHSHVASVEGLATQQQDSNSTSDLSTASSSTRHRGTYLSVASGPLARYASEGPSRPQSSIRSSPKSFFSSLLSRSPRSVSRSQGSVPDSIESASGSGSTSRSPQLSTPPRRSRHSVEGFSTSSSPQPNEYSPSASSPDLVDCSHLTESTTPTDPRTLLTSSAAKGSNGSDATAPSQSPPQRRTPLLAAVASFTRSASMMIRADSSPSSPPTHSNLTPAGVTSISGSGAISTGRTPEPTARVFSAPPQRSSENLSKLNGSATETEVTPTLESIGLGLASLTQSLSTSRHAQPLCGAILDDKYLLIGTTAGLEFLPLPVPGGVAQNVEGGRLSKNTRKPIQLIKKTRFKELTVLSERSNILLAIAGRNDHVRVYALEGIRAMINRAMATLDVQDGYAFSNGKSVESAELLAQDDPKGKGRATSGSLPQPAQAFRFPARAPAPITVPPPPEYSSLHTASNMPAPSPTRPPHRRQASLTTRPGLRHSSSSSIVRAVPMNPRLVSYHGPSTSGPTNANALNAFASSTTNAHASARSLRGSRSREFVASRRNSTATIVSKRRSRGDLNRYSMSSLNGERLNSSDAGPSWDESVSGLTSPLGNAASADVNQGQGNQDQSGRWESSTSASDSPSSHSTNGISSRSLSTTATEPDALPTDSGHSAQASPEVEVEPGPKPAMPTSDIESDNAQRDGWIDGTRMTAIKKIVPREPTIPRIAPGQVSPSMMLAEFFRDSEPPIETQDLEVPHDFDSNRTSSDSLAARRNSALPSLPDGDGDDPPQMRDRDGDAESRGGELLSGCSSSSSGSALSHVSESRVPPRRMIARDAKTTVRPDNGDDGPTEAMRGVTLAEIIRDDPPPPTKCTMLPTSTSVPNGLLTAPSPSTSGSGARASKRWSMGNVGSRLLSRPSTSNVDGSGSSSQSTRESALAAASSGPLLSTSTPWMAPRSASAPVLADNSDGDRPLPPRPSISETVASSSTIDNKRRSRPNTLEPPILKVPQSSRVPSDAHPANASSPLDYVKLARTKGARLLRAVETKKRTYLAVLGGDEGDRIELFTGSRGISLSLNRTFVLPERPRTIEFQLQGDDLVDIYLIYSDSIFALEPATVRVREVGVGRGERRARRERERRIRDLAASASEPVEGADLGERPLDPSLTPHPAESVSRRTPTPDSGRDESSTTSPDTPQAAMSAGNSSSGTPSGIPPPPHLPLGPNGDNSDTPSSLSTPTMVDSPLDPDDPSTIGSRLNAKFINAPYTTFQQLPFIPPVPSSILASAWTIPPLYTDVIGADADADAGAMDDADANVAMPDPPFSIPTAVYSNKAFSTGASRIEPPLLSPISLLGPAAHRSQGPPGLFFVTKGSNLSGIVTAEGKSVIKRPLVWSETAISPDPEQASFVEPNRVEMLICKRSRTVIINLARSGIHAIAVAGQERHEDYFGETLSVAPASGSSGNSLKEIAWLGTHASSQLFFAERVGSSFVIKCLYARH